MTVKDRPMERVLTVTLSFMVSVALLGWPAPLVSGDDPRRDGELQTRIVELVAELGNDAYAIRTAAQARLIEIGERARPFLEKYSTDDPEVASRVARIIDEIELATLAQMDIERVRRFSVLGGAVHAVAVSHNGRLMASGGERGDIILWDLEKSSQLRILRGHEHWVGGLAFDPGGKRLVSAAGDVILWDVETGKALERADVGTQSIDWSRDGRWIAFPTGNSGVRVVEAKKLRTEAFFPNERGAMDAVAFSADGERVAFGNRYGDTYIYDIESQERIDLRQVDDSRDVEALLFLPSGELVVGYSKGEIRVGDAKLEFVGTPSSLALSPAGTHLAACGQGGRILIWNLAQPNEEPKVLESKAEWTSAVAYHRDGRLVTGGADLRIWNGGECTVFGGHASTPESIAFSADSRFLAAVGKGTSFFALGTGELHHIAASGAVCADTAGSGFLQIAKESIDVWDPVKLERVASNPLELGTKAVRAALSPRGDQLVVSSYDSFVLVPRRGGEAQRIPGVHGRVLDQTWDSSGERCVLSIVTGNHGESGGFVVVAADGTVTQQHRIRDAVMSAVIHADDNSLYWTEGESIHRYDLSESKDKVISSTGASRIRFIGRRVVVTFQYSGISLWRLPDMRELRSIPAKDVREAAVSADGKYLAVAGLDSVTVYRVRR